MLRPAGEATAAMLACQRKLGLQLADRAGRLEEAAAGLRRTIEESGVMSHLPRAPDCAPWGVDGAVAISRGTAGAVATVTVAAVPTAGDALAEGETLEMPHTPAAERVVRARMVVREMNAAAALGREWGAPVLLDGSMRSTLVAVSQALNSLADEGGEAAALLPEPLLREWVDALGHIAGGECAVVAVPKLTSGYHIGRALGLPFPASDRELLTRACPPGQWAPYDLLLEALGAEVPAGKGDFQWDKGAPDKLLPRLKQKAERLLWHCAAGVVRPAGRDAPALLYECCGGEEALEAAGALLAETLPGRRLLEPHLLLAADHQAKELCSLHNPFVRRYQQSYRTAPG